MTEAPDAEKSVKDSKETILTQIVIHAERYYMSVQFIRKGKAKVPDLKIIKRKDNGEFPLLYFPKD